MRKSRSDAPHQTGGHGIGVTSYSGSTTGRDSRRTDHNDGMNVGYYDGHVKFHKRTFRPQEFGVD